MSYMLIFRSSRCACRAAQVRARAVADGHVARAVHEERARDRGQLARVPAPEALIRQAALAVVHWVAVHGRASSDIGC